MADACYLHSSLYAFSPEGVMHVIARFNAQVQHTSARCWYNRDQHAFCLTCPSHIGFAADEALGCVISSYIDSELDSSIREERPSTIRRFEESAFSELNTISSSPSSTDAMKGKEDVYTPPIALYSIRVLENEEPRANTIKLRYFRLRDLPRGELERYLAPARGAERAFQRGVTIRAVRWDSQQRTYAFAGRSQTSVPSHDHNTLPTLPPLELTALRDEEHHEDAATLHNMPEDQLLRSADELPIVEGFLAGVQQMELESPDKRAVPPPDAQMFMDRPASQLNVTGRVRVAKGAVTRNEAGSDIRSDLAESESLFSHLLASKSNRGSSDNKSNASRESNSEEEGTFESLLVNKIPVSSSAQPILGAAPTAGCLQSSKGTESPVKQLHDGHRSSVKGLASSEIENPVAKLDDGAAWGEGPEYAKVDKLGLTSSAANQAKWELQRGIRKKKTKPSKYGIGRRADAPALSSAASNQPAPSSVASGTQEPHPSLSVFGASKTSTPAQPWENILVTEPARLGTLVDTEVVSDASTAKVPPGFNPSRKTQRVSEPQRIGAIEDHAQRAETPPFLIDLDQGPVASAESISDPTKQSHASLLAAFDESPQLTHNASDAASSFAENETPHERVQAPPPKLELKYTMRQRMPKDKGKGRAGGKGTAKTAAKTRGKVELPLPEPLGPSSSAKARPQALADSSRDKSQASSSRPSNQRGSDQGSSEVQGPTAAHCADQGLSEEKGATAAQSSDQQVAPGPRRPSPAATSQLTSVPGNQQSSDPRESFKGKQRLLEERPQKDNTSASRTRPMSRKRPQFGLLETFRYWGYDLTADLTGDFEDLQLNIEFGVIVTQFPSQDDTGDGAHSVNEVSKKLKERSSSTKTDFFAAITTSELDARYMMGLIGKGAIEAHVEYEIIIKDNLGQHRTILFEQTSKEGFEVSPDPIVLGLNFSVYPEHVWGVKTTLTRPTIETPSEAICEFVRSLDSAPDVNSFSMMVPRHLFTIQRAYVRRLYTRDLGPLVWEVSSHSELELTPIYSLFHNLKATMLPPDRAIPLQRFWWQAKFVVPDVTKIDADNVHELQGVIDETLERLDRVGHSNQGPFVKLESSKDKPGAAPQVPFW